MKKYLSILQKSPLFSEIGESELFTLLDCLGGTVREYPRGTAILREGDRPTHLGVVLVGEVRITRTDYYGNRSIVAAVKAPHVFGETFACAEVESLPVDVTADSDCTVLMIAVSRVLNPCCNGCRFHNRIIYNLMKQTASKNLLFHRKLEITSKRTTRDKIMTYLLITAKEQGSNTVTIPYDRQELADYLEVDRSGLSAEISKLRREGVLTAEKNRFTLL
jgi:CRP-like cAMP-binding protein